jgi:hypothetical protein
MPQYSWPIGVEDGIGDGRRDADHPELAHALDAERVDHGVVLLDEQRLHLVDVRVDRHVVVLEVRVHDPPVTVVDFGGLLERHANAPDHAADLLAVRGLGVDDRAAGCHLEGACDADGPQVRLHLHLDELRAVRQRCVLPALLRGARLKHLGELSEAIALHDFGDADDTRRVAFESQPAVEHLDVGGGSPLQLSSTATRRRWPPASPTRRMCGCGATC